MRVHWLKQITHDIVNATYLCTAVQQEGSTDRDSQATSALTAHPVETVWKGSCTAAAH